MQCFYKLSDTILIYENNKNLSLAIGGALIGTGRLSASSAPTFCSNTTLFIVLCQDSILSPVKEVIDRAKILLLKNMQLIILS